MKLQAFIKKKPPLHSLLKAVQFFLMFKDISVNFLSKMKLPETYTHSHTIRSNLFFFFFYNYVFLENTSVDNIHCSEISKCVKDYYSYTWTLRQAANTFLLCPLSVHSGSHFDSWKAFMQCLTLTIKIPSLQNAKLHQMLHLVFALLDFLIWLCSIYSLPTVLCGCYSRSLKQY